MQVFDHSANGSMIGEGCNALVIKRLSHAKTDGNHILAVIRNTCALHRGSPSPPILRGENGFRTTEDARDAVGHRVANSYLFVLLL